MPTRAHCMAVARDPSSGAALTSATVQVYSPGTTTQIAATIYDKSGNVLSNPLTSDASTGLIDFYLNVSQEVDLVVSKNGFTTRTYSNVPVLDDASYELTALLTTTGDTAYASNSNTPARLAIGSTGAFLTVSGGVPSWSNTIAAGGLTVSAGNVSMGGSASGQSITTHDGLSFLRFQDEITLADSATAALITGQTNRLSISLVLNRSTGHVAIVACTGGVATTAILAQDASEYSTTANNATTTNIYWSGTRFEIQNKTGASRVYDIVAFSN